MRGNKIRDLFLKFFESKGHKIVSSDALVPKDDPTLLFTSAGMTQFKEQFMGKNITYKRATSCQKCLRTGDLDNVGKTSGHHTFFEMLGNFSFGDYFKKEACMWAWEFMTKVLKLPEKKLWISVYKDDDEAYGIWLKDIKIPKEKIMKFGEKDNFWPANAPGDGPNGPCGPCSEIFYDWGKDTGCGKKDCGPSCGCGRFVEVWNLVFTQFNRVGKNKLEPLPTKNIDTGMGLERVTAVMQGVKTNFETDLFKPIIKEIKAKNEKLKASELNTIADHLRAVTFAICDGVPPSNEERGYVVKKLIRRAYLLSKSNKPFLYNIVPIIADVMEGPYPIIKKRREDISSVIRQEEEKFQNTLCSCLPRLEELIQKCKTEKNVPGEEIFKLVDTYGLPIEVIEARAKKAKYKIDISGFEECMKKQKELSRKGSKIEGNIFAKLTGEQKKRIAANHTSTHLLQSALRKVLGEHVRQAGSLVEEGRLRFDFTHRKKLEEREIERVEKLVNEKINEGIDVEKKEKPKKIAEKEGAIALFGEKYGDIVRVVSVGDFSKEFCGGAHVDNTSEIGLFKIIREASIAAGVRRIEAVTGDDAREWIEESAKRKAKSEKARREKEEEKLSLREKEEEARKSIEEIIKKSRTVKGVKVIVEEIKNANINILRAIADGIKAREKSAVIILMSKDGGKAFIVVSLTNDLIQKGMDASSIVKELAKPINGAGGGRKDFAQAGGKETDKIDMALKNAREMTGRLL